ncbi:hypothetical protein YOLOSWAG_122 [Erwinia phage vB_EamM_Yoloswag]|uniref:Uncharacterized protein n=1 Tax=Erwinia phage vB_EamM_Yoloswag TaxID=1958956 RepID=A0A1S6L358_9CAUD|nr:hypothetical protein HOR66_gp122 [Erwinia phage vB_EamM_Yoloswag]AQT28603.1 hypothetical protein YOLOSWAG_122 [Erwinia phage vB_EamM_Yoloswag]
MADEHSIGGVQGQGYLGMLLDGKAPPNTPGLVRSVHVIENPMTVPCAVIEFTDRNNVLRDKNAIVDGTQITISMGPSMDAVQEVIFRVIGVREYEDSGTRILRTVCAFDAPTFIYDSRSWAIQGTSLDALKKLCDACGLSLDSGDLQPKDNMKWLSATQSPKRFAGEIEKHMWLGEDAMPKMLVTADHRMIIRDLNKVLEQDPTAVICYNTANANTEYQAQELRTKSTSGTFNGVSNYGDVLLWSDSKGQTNSLKSIKIKTRDPLNINSDTRGDIVGARKQYARPTNDANMHDSFMKAYYNWKRQALLYTETARVLILGGAPTINGLDCIEVKASLPTSKEDQRTDYKSSGKWIVIGKTRSFYSGQYSETLLLARNFTPVEGTTGIGGGANIAETIWPTVANVLRPFQINTNILQSLAGLNPIDLLSQQHTLRLNLMLDQFQTDSEMFNFPELAEKYGEGADYLKSLMQEFSMASFINSICGTLNELEKLSINVVIDYGPTILSALAGRVDQMEGLMTGFTSDINGLVADGNIPDYYLDGPQINQTCVSNKLSDLQKSLDDALPDKCMDALSMGSLLGPKTNLSQLLRQAEEDLRNLLCSLGDGTVDGSGTTGTATGQKLEMYLPKVAS